MSEDIDFPESWKKLKDQPLPPKPDSVFEFLSLVNVSDEELRRKRPVSKMFHLDDDLADK